MVMGARFAVVVALVGVVATGLACDFGSVTPAPTDPNAPTGPVPPATAPSEVFTGSVAILSDTKFHNFTTLQTGDVSVTLAALAPSATTLAPQVLVALGTPTPDGTRCDFDAHLVNFTGPGPNLVLPVVSIAAGTYCVGIEDQFRLAPFTYTVHVWHK